MPIYEYKCVDCGKNLELMQKISDAPLTVCPNCAGKLEKQWSLSGFQFKGSGWYVSDYTNRGKESGADGKSAENAGAETKSSDSGAANSESSKTTETSAAPQTSANGESTASAATASKPAAKPAKTD